MSAHTPGPWIVKGTRIYDIAPGIDCIATMQTSNQTNWDADARLISAAPDLLEALQLCAAVCAGETMNKQGLINALEKARAAISKAKGQS